MVEVRDDFVSDVIIVYGKMSMYMYTQTVLNYIGSYVIKILKFIFYPEIKLCQFKNVET